MVVHKRGSETGGFSTPTVADRDAAASVHAISVVCHPRGVESAQLTFGVLKFLGGNCSPDVSAGVQSRLNCGPSSRSRPRTVEGARRR